MLSWRVCAAALGIVLYGSTVLLPVMLQTLSSYTAQLSGLVLSPGAILTLISLPLVGRLLAKYQASWLVLLGLLILASGMYALSLLNLYTSFGTFVLVWMNAAFRVVSRRSRRTEPGWLCLLRHLLQIQASLSVRSFRLLADRLAAPLRTAPFLRCIPAYYEIRETFLG